MDTTTTTSPARTVTYEVPAGHRIVAYLIPDTAQPATIDHLAAVQAALAARVRTYGPDDNAAWLLSHLPDPADWFRAAFMGAVAMPIETMRWEQLVRGAVRGTAPRHLPREARDIVDSDHRAAASEPEAEGVEAAGELELSPTVQAVCAGQSIRLSLHERRLAVAAMTAAGIPTGEIARRLQIAPDTVYRNRGALRRHCPSGVGPSLGRAAA